MQFTSTPQDLLNAANFCTNTNQEIQTNVQRVQTYIQGLIATYQGPAATQLQATAEQWARDAAAVNAVLNEIAINLQKNAQNYSNNEQANVANLAGVGAQLGAVRL